jgi:hypothetical protein
MYLNPPMNMQFLTGASNAHRVAAEIWVRPDKEPVRLQRNGRLKKPMGLYPSVKSGRLLPYEARSEALGFWHAEADPEVVQSWAQPHTLKMTVDGMACRYTPDREDELAGGGTRIVEMKSEFDERRDPFYTRKLAAARAIYEGLGWSFRIVTRPELEAQPVFDAVERIQRYRGAYVDPADWLRVQDVLKTEHCTFGGLVERLGGGVRAEATLCAMHVHGAVRVDFRNGLGAQSAVELGRSSPFSG